MWYRGEFIDIKELTLRLRVGNVRGDTTERTLVVYTTRPNLKTLLAEAIAALDSPTYLPGFIREQSVHSTSGNRLESSTSTAVLAGVDLGLNE
jgi:hypothetical protein